MTTETLKSTSQRMRWTKIVSRSAGSGVLLFNLFFFLPKLIKYEGWQLFENDNTIFTLLWLIPAVATWISKSRTDFYLCIINFCGFVWSVFMLLLILANLTIDN